MVAQGSAPAAPLPLSRVHRLLRPLRSSLSSVQTSLSLASSRSNDLLLHRPPPIKGKPRDLIDREYAEGQPNSSPFQSTKRRHQKTTTYGSRAAQSRAREPNKVVAAPVPLDPRSRLLAAGLDAETVLKVFHLVRAFRNVLECVYGQEKDAVKGSRDPSSLVEIAAREVGWGIEDAVRSCVDEAGRSEDEDDDNEGRRKRAKSFEVEDDVTLLVDEWYEATPAYSRRSVLAQHATSIVLDGLQDSSFEILEALFEICLSLNAYPETSRFYAPLCLAGLCKPSSSALSLAQRAATLSQQSHFFSALQSTLLSSAFASRLFYSDFLVLSYRLTATPASCSLVADLLHTLVAVADEMLISITRAEDTTETPLDGSSLATEVVVRLSRELTTATPFLLTPTPSPSLPALVDSFVALLRHPASEPLFSTTLLLLLSLPSPSPSSLSLLSSHPLPRSTLLPLLSPLLPLHSTQSLSKLCTTLHAHSLFSLASVLLDLGTSSYDSLSDVRSTRGLPVLSRAVLADQQREVEGREVEAKGGYRYESMIGGFVVATPALRRTILGPASEGESPLDGERLGRAFVLAATPSRGIGTRPRRRIVVAESESSSAGSPSPPPPSSPVRSKKGGKRKIEVLDLSMDDSDLEITLGSSSSPPSSSTVQEEDDLRLEILEEPLEGATSEADDLDFLSASQGVARGKRVKGGHVERRRVTFHGVEESEDELGM